MQAGKEVYIGKGKIYEKKIDGFNSWAITAFIPISYYSFCFETVYHFTASKAIMFLRHKRVNESEKETEDFKREDDKRTAFGKTEDGD